MKRTTNLILVTLVGLCLGNPVLVVNSVAAIAPQESNSVELRRAFATLDNVASDATSVEDSAMVGEIEAGELFSVSLSPTARGPLPLANEFPIEQVLATTSPNRLAYAWTNRTTAELAQNRLSHSKLRRETQIQDREFSNRHGQPSLEYLFQVQQLPKPEQTVQHVVLASLSTQESTEQDGLAELESRATDSTEQTSATAEIQTGTYRIELVAPDWNDAQLISRNALQLSESLQHQFIFSSQLQERWWLGVEGVEPPESLINQLGITNGILVNSVAPGSPAFKSGVNQFDVVVSYSGESLNSPQHLAKLVQIQEDRPASLAIIRHGEPVELTIQAERVGGEAQSEERDIVVVSTLVNGEVDLRPIQRVVTHWEQLEPEQQLSANLRMLLVRPGVVVSKEDPVGIERVAVIADGQEIVQRRNIAIAGQEMEPASLLFREDGNVRVIGDAQMEDLPDSLRHWVSRFDRLSWHEHPVNVGGSNVFLFPPQSELHASIQYNGNFEFEQVYNSEDLAPGLNPEQLHNLIANQYKLDSNQEFAQFRVRGVENFRVENQESPNPDRIFIEFSSREGSEGQRATVSVETSEFSGEIKERLQRKRSTLQAALDELETEIELIELQIEQLNDKK